MFVGLWWCFFLSFSAISAIYFERNTRIALAKRYYSWRAIDFNRERKRLRGCAQCAVTGYTVVGGAISAGGGALGGLWVPTSLRYLRMA